MAPSMRLQHSEDDGFALDLLQSMRCGLIITDRDGVIRFMNEQSRRILDLGEIAAAGRGVAEVLEAHPHLARLLVDAHALRTLPDRAEAEIRTRDHKGRTIGYTVTSVRGEDGHSRGAAMFFKDLTPIEHEEAKVRLRERLAELGAMAAALAHEIRNPLAALDLSTTLLRRRLKNGGEEERRLAGTIQDQIRRLSRTVNSSLEFVRPLDLTPVEIDLRELVDDAVGSASPDGDADIDLVRSYPDTPVRATADAMRLREAVINVIRNACEAMRDQETRRLAVQIEETTAGPSIRVTDTGPGIPEPIREKIFHPFFSTKPQGSGLGLAWCRKVIDAHGGVLDVDVGAQGGTAVIIRLPAAAAPVTLAAGDNFHEAQNPDCRR